MDNDCGFIRKGHWFRYRAAAIIIEDGAVLLAKNEVDDYYYSVGGGVHMGETAEEAVRREVLEETGVAYEIDHMVFVHENFFEGHGSLAGLHCHEIAFYFLMKPRGSQVLNSHSTTQNGIPEHMYWVPVGELGKQKAFPSFLPEKIGSFGSGIEHIVTQE